ncbi:hypothetical protein GQ55_3G310200 [Panicum hallii var. hallii]|uniref:Uncharacterized protein n=1 Tax=Panicum hallii var. hallii TaxID=1504633 RepID=A0A2T7EF53_9POAL|nr:hypothetical protein GQ55_3G310200 [Panicum hallii var. hallii]
MINYSVLHHHSSRLLAALLSPTTIWTVALWICMPALRNSFSFRTHTSFLYHLLAPYALYFARIFKKPWDSIKSFINNKKSQYRSAADKNILPILFIINRIRGMFFNLYGTKKC